MTPAELRTIAKLLKERALEWRVKAQTDIKAHPDSCILRAQECEECARIVESLKEIDP